MNILDEMTQVFHEVFEDDSIVLSREMTADELDAWDSMSHVTLLMGVEDHFDVIFEQWEVMDLPNVGALMDLAEKKLAEK